MSHRRGPSSLGSPSPTATLKPLTRRRDVPDRGTMHDHALGALVGLTIGDALGMPTQSMSPEQIRARYGWVDGFLDAAADQPIAPSMPAGSITDDTEQALMLGTLLVEGSGYIDPHLFADALLRWETDMRARGSLDLLGPSTEAALTKLEQGTAPEETGRFGTTNGAAMRVAPVGIAFPLGRKLADAVYDSAMVTHCTGLGLSSAGMIAAVISAGIEGATMSEALDCAVAQGRELAKRGNWVAGASVAERYLSFKPLADGLEGEALQRFLHDVVGTSVQSQESVVTSLLLASRNDLSPTDALCFAVNLGGDTDTIAAMTGAMLGAVHGVQVFDREMKTKVECVNNLDFTSLITQLLEIRLRVAP